MTEDKARSKIASRVSRETLERLEIYHHLLLKWQTKVNLIARTTVQDAWSRHFLDSVQVFDASPVSRGRWLDLGSGGGFPGLVCAIVATDKAPELDFELVDSDQRKCSFLREVARQTGTSAYVHNSRIEKLSPRHADVVSARAVAPLTKLLDWIFPHLRPGGICLLQKGAAHLEELESARKHWQMDVDILPSVTAADSVILRIRNLVHAS